MPKKTTAPTIIAHSTRWQRDAIIKGYAGLDQGPRQWSLILKLTRSDGLKDEVILMSTMHAFGSSRAPEEARYTVHIKVPMIESGDKTRKIHHMRSIRWGVFKSIETAKAEADTLWKGTKRHAAVQEYYERRLLAAPTEGIEHLI